MRTAMSQLPANCGCIQRQLCHNNKLVIACKDSLVTVMKWLWLYTGTVTSK